MAEVIENPPQQADSAEQAVAKRKPTRKQSLRPRQPVVIEPMEWLLEDRRPPGYVQTTDLRLRAEALGIKYREAIPTYLRRSWHKLLKKAKSRGLTERECKRVVDYSIIIAHKLRKAIEAHQDKAP